MSLLNRIAEQQGATKQQDVGRHMDMQAEAQKPNAVQDADSQRAGYSEAFAGTPAQDMQEEMPEAKEQEDFTIAERQMAELVYGENASEKILNAVRKGQDPVAGVGKMAAEVLRATVDKVNVELTEDALLALGETAVEQIVDILEASDNSIDLTSEQMAEALSIGVGHWMSDNPEAMGAREEYLNGEAPDQLAPQGPMAQMGQQAQPQTQGV